MSVRVVNPETGREVVGPSTGYTVTPVPAPTWARALRDRWVKVSPSMRPNMPYDLCTYPDEWIVE